MEPGIVSCRKSATSEVVKFKVESRHKQYNVHVNVFMFRSIAGLNPYNLFISTIDYRRNFTTS